MSNYDREDLQAAHPGSLQGPVISAVNNISGTVPEVQDFASFVCSVHEEPRVSLGCSERVPEVDLNASYRGEIASTNRPYISLDGSLATVCSSPLAFGGIEPPSTQLGGELPATSTAENVELGDESNVVSKVLKEMRKKFQDVYNSDAWTRKLPVQMKISGTSIYTLYDLSVTTEASKLARCESILSPEIFENRECSLKMVLVQGAPGFGKTTLCAVLAHQWALNMTEMKDFKLCIHCNLQELNLQGDIVTGILEFCAQVLDEPVDRRTLSQVLSEHGDQIVLLLDGYNELEATSQRAVISFFDTETIFLESTVLVTTRPTRDRAFLNKFKTLVTINGFSEKYLTNLLASNENRDNKISDFSGLVHNKHLGYLYGLSPFFTSVTSRVISESFRNCRSPKSLFALLEQAVQIILSQDCTFICDVSRPASYVTFIEVLGKIFFNALVIGQYEFTEKELRESLGDGLELFMQCNVFYEDPREGQNTRVWIVSNKVLMVFFATVYLRNVWNSFSTMDKCLNFITDILCYGENTGDFITTDDNGTCLFYLEVLPEILLKISKGIPVQNSTIEMFYDAECYELNEHLDSSYMLLRAVSTPGREFGFSVVQNDELDLHMFEDMYNVLSALNYSIDFQFFRNRYEEKNFMKISVSGQEEKKEILRAAFRADNFGNIDKFRLEFTFAEVYYLFDLVSNIISRCMIQVELHEGLKHNDLENFIFTLAWRISESEAALPVVVSCEGNLNDAGTFSRTKIINRIFSEVGTGERIIRFSCESLTNEMFSSDHRLYNLHNFWANRKQIQEDIKRLRNTMSSPKICIKV